MRENLKGVCASHLLPRFCLCRNSEADDILSFYTEKPES